MGRYNYRVAARLILQVSFFSQSIACNTVYTHTLVQVIFGKYKKWTAIRTVSLHVVLVHVLTSMCVAILPFYQIYFHEEVYCVGLYYVSMYYLCVYISFYSVQAAEEIS